MDYKSVRMIIKKYRSHLTRQEVKTINGQLKSNDLQGATKGLIKILKRKGVEVRKC